MLRLLPPIYRDYRAFQAKIASNSVVWESGYNILRSFNTRIKNKKMLG
jgi:hypothetical protein